MYFDKNSKTRIDITQIYSLFIPFEYFLLIYQVFKKKNKKRYTTIDRITLKIFNFMNDIFSRIFSILFLEPIAKNFLILFNSNVFVEDASSRNLFQLKNLTTSS